MARSTILVCGPSPEAVGGGPAHVRNLWASPLREAFRLELFETGSRGRESPARDEPPLAAAARLLAGPFALGARIVRLRPALVHINTAVDPRGFWREVLHVAVARLLRCPVLYQIHGGSLERLTAGPLMGAIARAVYGWPDVVVVLARSEERAFGRLGTVRRLAVVPNAVDVAAFRDPAGRVHSGRALALGYVGRLVDGKGLFETLAAVDALRREPAFAGLELRLAGSGDAAARLQAEIERRGLAAAVRLVGPLPRAAIPAFLRSLDLFVLPSESEGLPYSVLESLAAGTPVLASPVGGLPDVVVHGTRGWLLESRDPAGIADALRALASDPARLQAMSRACEAYAVRELGLDRLARQFGGLYHELGAG